MRSVAKTRLLRSDSEEVTNHVFVQSSGGRTWASEVEHLRFQSVECPEVQTLEPQSPASLDELPGGLVIDPRVAGGVANEHEVEHAVLAER